MDERIYICIDLKSFFASVECVERGLDPFKTNLVVADPSRGRGAICLAVTPALKELGVRNRCRIFEIPETIKYITALPRMKLYIKYSEDIYSIYLKYISKDNIHVYSVDECFLDVTDYLVLYGKNPKEMAILLMEAVFEETGICATAGIGTNLFLAKLALDITAKHAPDHIGLLDIEKFRQTLWHHTPITDIWNIGRGIENRLEKYGVNDLCGIANADSKILYKEFGVNAEYLIDHANGIEPCTIEEIHNYKAQNRSMSNSQILFEDYNSEDAFIVMKEMVDALTLELIAKHFVTNNVFLSIGYSKGTLKQTGGSRNVIKYTNSFKALFPCFERIYQETVNTSEAIRRISIGFNNLIEENEALTSLFDNTEINLKEQKKQEAILSIKHKLGKNAILRGMSLQEKATAAKRNKLIGGHNGE